MNPEPCITPANRFKLDINNVYKSYGGLVETPTITINDKKIGKNKFIYY